MLTLLKGVHEGSESERYLPAKQETLNFICMVVSVETTPQQMQ